MGIDVLAMLLMIGIFTESSDEESELSSDEESELSSDNESELSSEEEESESECEQSDSEKVSDNEEEGLGCSVGDDDHSDDGHESESDSESDWVYASLSESERAKTSYSDKVSEIFIDIEDPHCPEEFVILDVCRCLKSPSTLFYKYILTSSETLSEEEFEFTPCEEIINCETYVFQRSDALVGVAISRKRRATTKGTYSYEERDLDGSPSVMKELSTKRSTRNCKARYYY